MTFENSTYVPCLRWKQGEYQAVHRLPDSIRDSLCPIIEVPEMGWDFETETYKKTLDTHLEPFAKRVKAKWGDRNCFIDTKLIPPDGRFLDGRHPVRLIFEELENRGCNAIPVVSFESDRQHLAACRKHVANRGASIRIPIESAASNAFRAQTRDLLAHLKLRPSDCHLILDLGSPNFVPVEGFGKLLLAVIGKLPNLNRWQTFTLLSGSFPESMAAVKTSPSVLHRYEWILYKSLTASLRDSNVRVPNFGDYAVSHPAVLNLDMRRVKPAASIRYTSSDAWFVVKGKNVRDNGFGQYRGLCSEVVASEHFCGEDFSWGDEHIAKCHRGEASTGNLSTWRSVGTNHHMTKVVVQDLATFHD